MSVSTRTSRTVEARPIAIALAAFAVLYIVLSLRGIVDYYADSTIYIPPEDGSRFQWVHFWPNASYTRAGWGTQLLYALAPTNGTRVAAQIGFGVVAWATAAWVLWLRITKLWARILAVGVVMLTALSPLVVQWNTILLTESLAIGAGALIGFGSLALVVDSTRAPAWLPVVPVTGVVVLGATRPTAISAGLPALAIGLLAFVLRSGRSWRFFAAYASIVAVIFGYVFAASAREEHLVNESTHDVASPGGGFAAERSYGRGNDPFWVELERDAGRPRCPAFDQLAADPVVEDVSGDSKDDAVRTVRTECPKLYRWWRDGGLSPVRALLEPRVWKKYIAEVLVSVRGTDDWTPPVYHPRFSRWQETSRYVYGPLGVVLATVAGIAVHRALRRSWRIGWWSVGFVLAAIGGAVAFGVATWVTTPVEPARHAGPWPLLLPSLVFLALALDARGPTSGAEPRNLLRTGADRDGA